MNGFLAVQKGFSTGLESGPEVAAMLRYSNGQKLEAATHHCRVAHSAAHIQCGASVEVRSRHIGAVQDHAVPVFGQHQICV